MGNAARAYDYAAERAYERERYAQPDIRVMRGQGAANATQTLSPSVVFLAKTAAVVLVVLALLGIARVTLSSAAVTASLETQQLSGQIESARVDGNKLEVAQSALSNPTRIKDAAAGLGMAAPAETIKMDLSGDVVVTDASGTLSLSGSVAAAAQR